jgi:glycosyltransferase involved in cell wall biosynthesis
MVSFQARLAAELDRRGIQAVFDLAEGPYQAVLVVGGTRQLGGLWRARRLGIPVVQRLDGRNWLHRMRPASVRHTLRAEYGNWLLQVIRGNLATGIVYQSQFSKQWWEAAAGRTGPHNRVIYNGVDLAVFTPTGEERPPQAACRVIMVEGSLLGGYELGLEHAVELIRRLQLQISHPVELVVAGRTSESVRQRMQQAGVKIHWAGLLARDQIPALDRGGHMLFSADINPACPNAVIEALACGLPVIAYDTGALGELVQGGAGEIVPYSGDPWKLEAPDHEQLARTAAQIWGQQARYRPAARQRAETAFGAGKMVDEYLAFIQELL